MELGEYQFVRQFFRLTYLRKQVFRDEDCSFNSPFKRYKKPGKGCSGNHHSRLHGHKNMDNTVNIKLLMIGDGIINRIIDHPFLKKQVDRVIHDGIPVNTLSTDVSRN